MSADQIKDSGLRADSRARNVNLNLYGSFQRGEHKISFPNAGDDSNVLLSEGALAINGDVTFAGAATLANATISAGGYLNVDSATGTAATSAVTISKMAGVITSEALTTAAAGTEAIVVTNTAVAAADLVFVSVTGGTNTQNSFSLEAVPAAGSFTLNINNTHASAAFDGTFIVSFLVLKA